MYRICIEIVRYLFFIVRVPVLSTVLLNEIMIKRVKSLRDPHLLSFEEVARILSPLLPVISAFMLASGR